MSNIQPNRFQDISLRIQKQTSDKDAPGNGSEKAMTPFLGDTLEVQNTLPLQTADNSGFIPIYVIGEDDTPTLYAHTTPELALENDLVPIMDEEGNIIAYASSEDAAQVQATLPEASDGNGTVEGNNQEAGNGTGQGNIITDIGQQRERTRDLLERNFFAIAGQSGNANKVERDDFLEILRVLQNKTPLTEEEQEMLEVAYYIIREPEGQETWRIFDPENAGLAFSDVQNINPDTLAPPEAADAGVASNIESPEVALTELLDPALQDMLEDNSDAPERGKFDRTSLEKLAAGEGDFANTTQSQRDAAAYLLENKNILDYLDTLGNENGMRNNVYGFSAIDALLENPDVLDNVINPPIEYTINEAAGVLADATDFEELLTENSSNLSQEPGTFDLFALRGLAAGTGEFATATPEQRAAAQHFVDNEEALNQLDEADGSADGTFSFASFTTLSQARGTNDNPPVGDGGGNDPSVGDGGGNDPSVGDGGGNDPSVGDGNDPSVGEDNPEQIQPVSSEEEAIAILNRPDILTRLDGNGDGLIHFDHLKQLAEGTGEFAGFDEDVRAAAQFYVNDEAARKRWDAYGANTNEYNSTEANDSLLSTRYIEDSAGTPDGSAPVTEPPSEDNSEPVQFENEIDAVNALIADSYILTRLDGDGDGLIHFDHLKQLANGEPPFENASPEVRAAAQFYVDNAEARMRWDAYQANNNPNGDPNGEDDGEYTTQMNDSLLSINYLYDFSGTTRG
jgi:hypothetical protein